jgi:hypothetical protein
MVLGLVPSDRICATLTRCLVSMRHGCSIASANVSSAHPGRKT